MNLSAASPDMEDEVVVSLPEDALLELVGEPDAWSDAPSTDHSSNEPDTEVAFTERRRSPRLTPDAFPAELRLAVAGCPMRLVDLSASGLMAETSQRLCPGRRVDVFLRYGGARKVLKATVVRSAMHAVAPSPVFRAALEFEVPLSLPGSSL